MDKPGGYSVSSHYDILDEDSLEKLRNSCRDEKEAISAVKYIDKLLPLAIEGRVKALQVLCNICYHVPSARETVYTTSGRELVAVLKAGKDGEQLSLTCRLLFFATIGSSVCEEELQKSCFNLLNKRDEEVKLFALRILYNVIKLLEAIEEVEQLVSVALSSEEQNGLKVRGAAVNLLLKGKVEFLDARITSDQLNTLLCELLQCTEKTIIQDHLPSYCQLITGIANGNDQKRHELRSKICNNKALLSHIKSPHPETVLACGDLIMSLVKSDPKRFLHALGGYGQAAGYLYMRKIDISQQPSSFDESQELSSDEEYLREHGLEDASLLPQGPPEMGEMTEEEKEREAERLLDLFERLEKTGVVKVFRKDDQ